MVSRVRRAGPPSGFVRLKFLLVALVVAGLGYVGSKVVPAYWDYLSIQDPVKEAVIAYARHGKEAEVRAELIARARHIGVALDEEQVDIGQEGSLIVVRVAWEVPLELPLYRRTLHFRIEKTAPAP